jgi:hypothetical protein
MKDHEPLFPEDALRALLKRQPSKSTSSAMPRELRDSAAPGGVNAGARSFGAEAALEAGVFEAGVFEAGVFEAGVLGRIAAEKRRRSRLAVFRWAVLAAVFLLTVWLGNNLLGSARNWLGANSGLLLELAEAVWNIAIPLVLAGVERALALLQGAVPSFYPTAIAVLLAALLVEIVVCLNLNPKKLT